jgi:FADH2 O2-dependent halogenase
VVSERIHDLAVVGSAFGGSLLAGIVRRMGRSVVLIERGHHPRFAIGESSTPLTNLLLEELAAEHGIPELATFAKWGSWRRHHPEVGVGLKRGFTFYHHVPGRPWSRRADQANELLVAASPKDEVADTHWYRPDFDAYWVDHALRSGVEYLDETEVTEFDETSEDIRLRGQRRGENVSVRARFLVDASGPRGFLFRQLGWKEARFDPFPEMEALFAHFRGVERWDSLEHTGPPPANFPPYPPDDAALHHVFPGGWMWVLRFDHGVTSAGVSVHPDLARDLDLRAGAPAWLRLMDRLPSVACQFRKAQPVTPFFHSPCLSFRSPEVSGTRWALLPSAAGFLDPLLSTGFPLTLLGVQRLSRLFRLGPVPEGPALADYATETRQDLECVAELLGALLSTLHQPAVFEALSLLYFAAASFAESARRLDRPHLAPGFLLRDHPDFRHALRDLAAAAREPSTNPVEFRRRVETAIEPFDVAGLRQPSRRPGYPVDLDTLYRNRHKLGVDAEAITSMLRRCGMR